MAALGADLAASGRPQPLWSSRSSELRWLTTLVLRVRPTAGGTPPPPSLVVAKAAPGPVAQRIAGGEGALARPADHST